MGPSLLTDCRNSSPSGCSTYRQLVRLDIADDVIVVIATEANVTVAIDLHCHVDADTLVVPEGFLMILCNNVGFRLSYLASAS